MNIVQSISKLRLLDFISCCVDKYYNIVGGEEQWIILLTQFQEVRKEEFDTNYREILWRLQQLRVRYALIKLLSLSVGMIYSKSLIDELRSIDEEFQQFEFTEDSLESDLVIVENIEKNNEIEYRQLLEDLKIYEDKNIGSVKINAEEIFYDYVMAYNEAFKTSHGVDRLSTMEYAKMCYRYDEYCKRLSMEKHM